ncbi:MAG: glycoside hydrolase family 3 protein, partial [Legionella longbeachae]|nr:glycoside hydrolase family 3 protein [Legionella longbeachae]
MKSCFSLLISLCFFINSTVNATPEVSLRDKIGQMLLIGFDGKKIDAQSPIVKTIEKNNIGGVILFDFDFRSKTYDRNIESPEQVKQLNGDLQYFTLQGNLKYHRPELPLLISVDYEGGKVNRLGEQYGFPQTISAAEVGKRPFGEAESIAEAMAQTLYNTGFNLNFAPVLDVNVNP